MATKLPRAGLRAERMARAAAVLLAVRVVEGLGAWLYFNEFFLGASSTLVVQGAFVLYLLCNLLVILRYRRVAVTLGFVGIDLAANAILLGPAVVQSGGLASPLLLLMPLKALEYGVVFSPPIALIFVCATVCMFVGIGVARYASLLTVTSFFTLPPDRAETALTIAVVTLVVGAPLTVAWLLRAVKESPGRMTPEVAVVTDRDGTDAVVANALLRVSDTVSRLTRIEEILERVVEVAPHSVDVDYCGIALWSEDTGTYTGAVAAGRVPATDRRLAGLELSPAEVPDFEWVRRLGHCAVIPAADNLRTPSLEVRAVLIAPLLSGERFYGVMEFARLGASRAFTQRDLRIADGIARQTAVALERARLIENSRRLALALESTDEAVFITDARGRITFVNPAFERSFGYRSEEVLGRDAANLGGDGDSWLNVLEEALSLRSWRGEGVARRRDGTPIPVTLNTSLIRDDDGQTHGAVAILEDVSEERQRQMQMQRADRLAAVGEMAAGIAHEINNALVVIFGQMEDAAQLGEEGLRNRLAQIDGQARRIGEIVHGVLGFARPRSPSVQPTDVVRVVRETLDLYRHDLIRQKVELETDFDANLPRARADPQQLQQVLLNLCGNATQAMAPCAHKVMRIEVRGSTEYIRLLVTDTGPGIPAEVLPRVFDPFFSTKPEGSGLGLSVSYAIARAHGGDLQVSSDAERGTTFTLILPVDSGSTELALSRVLLVDDEPEVAEALAAMLTREGARVSRAATGGEALRMIEAEAWDAIFLDVRLPDLSGPEVYAEIQRRWPELLNRVAFVTGGLWRSESRLRRQLPPQPVLAKPCTQEDVREVLRQIAHRPPQVA